MKVLFSLAKHFRNCGHLVIRSEKFEDYPISHVLCIKGKPTCPDELEANTIQETGIYCYIYVSRDCGIAVQTEEDGRIKLF